MKKYIIKVITTIEDYPLLQDKSWVSVPKIGTFVCGTYDLCTTNLENRAFKFKSRETAQKFIDKVKDLIEGNNEMIIEEIDL